jgi:predicted MFS family arabinose efflux permease
MDLDSNRPATAAPATPPLSQPIAQPVSQPVAPSVAAAPPDAAFMLRILTIVCFTFIAYLTIGLPLAVLPGYVHHDLGMGSVLAGLVISVQYVATLASRPFAGRLSDSMGAKRVVLLGLALCVVSGAFYLLAAMIDAHQPIAAFVTLMIGRLFVGCAESLVGTGSIQWAIGAVGLQRTGKVISWNGVATYAGLAAGAPLGVVFVRMIGFEALGITVMALGVIGLLLAWRQTGVAAVHGERMETRHVFRHVMNYGLALGLGSMGFGAIATFITLYYASHDWSGAAFALTIFGVCFCGARLLFVDTIARFGGYRVALVSLVIEAAGLALLGFSPSSFLALVGAGLAGSGFALVFPALGVAAVEAIPLPSRGAALGVYSAFLDLALGATGPLAGIVAHHFGFSAVYVGTALVVLAGASIVIGLWSKARRASATSMLAR